MVVVTNQEQDDSHGRTLDVIAPCQRPRGLDQSQSGCNREL